MVLNDKAKPADSRVFIRGEANKRGSSVPRRFLEILSDKTRKPFRDGSGRLELAQAIASDDNPLTPRVIVNRIWQHHFGEGLVPTPDDLGTQAENPSHPLLLDYLAATFVEEGWSIKKLHRQILLSNAWRQSSDTNPQFEEIDPRNRLLWRANVRRLDFESVRDSLLALAGIIDLRMGGRPVDLTSEPFSVRRSVYGYVDRANPAEVFNHFNFANPDQTNGKRHQTIVPQQALFMMNSPLVTEAARRLIARSDFKKTRVREDRIKLLYEVVYQRPPTRQEIDLSLAYLRSSPLRTTVQAGPTEVKLKGAAARGKDKKDTTVVIARAPLGGWETFAQALLLSNEALFVN